MVAGAARDSADRETAVVLRGVSARYARSALVLRNVDLVVPLGACVAITGPSGGGKTTLLRVVLGLVAPEAGAVERPCLIRRVNGRGCGGIGYIPQNLGLVRNLTVLENVLLGALPRLSWWRSVIGRFSGEEVARAEHSLAAVGLDGRAGARIEALSGGQRRRVAIARALVQRPRLLLADEFLAELDRGCANEMIALVNQLRDETGVTVLFVEHDVETACRMAERIVVLADGQTVCELDAREVARSGLPSARRPSGIAW